MTHKPRLRNPTEREHARCELCDEFVYNSAAAWEGHFAIQHPDPVPSEFCDKHGGYVEEGRTRPMSTGSRYRICDGCAAEALKRVTASESYHDSPDCGYLMSLHLNGRCPEEATARAAFGDR